MTNRSAHDLVTLTESSRQSGVEQTSTQITSLNELDNIDVFDFFNFPKVSEPAGRPGNGPSSQSPQVQQQGDQPMRMPDPESDWLGYSGQY